MLETACTVYKNRKHRLTRQKRSDGRLGCVCGLFLLPWERLTK